MARELLLALGPALLACTPRPTADITPVTTAPSVQGVEQPAETVDSSSKPRWVDLSIESEFGCAVERTGAVICWGRGPAAEMGLRELPKQPPPESMVYGTRKWGPPSRLEFLDDARAISTATNLACAVVEDGRVRCWGAVQWGSSHVYDVAGITDAVELEIGDAESCARLENRELWCWGQSDHGLAQPRMSGTLAFTVGDNLACGLDEAGDITCWGQAIADWHRYSVQFNQQQGGMQQPVFGPPPEQLDVPDTVDVGRFRGAIDIALTGWNSLCVLRNDGKVACAQQDVSALLRGEDLGLQEIAETRGLAELAPTRTHVCGRTLDDRALCWGRNAYGQLGDGDSQARDRAVAVAGLTGVVELSVTEDLSCALTRDGRIACWGFDRGEALGHEDTHVHTLADLQATSIAAYGRTTCAVGKVGLRCWGADSLEQTGILAASTPRDLGLPPGGDIVELSTAWEGCVLLSSGALHCGNWNTLGTNNFAVTTTLHDVRAYASGMPPTCAIVGTDKKPSLRCGSSFTTMSPERQIDAPTKVAAANMRACAVHGGGRVSCFGELYSYGDPAPPARAITRIDDIRDAVDIASSVYHDCVLHKRGTVSCWVGRSETEWLPDGRAPKSIRYVASASRDMGLDKVVQIVAGNQHHCALTSTGVVRCWGDNPYAEAIAWQPVPQLPDDVVELAAGSEHTCARTRGGAVTCWGDDIWGQLGRVPSRVYLRPKVMTPMNGVH